MVEFTVFDRCDGEPQSDPFAVCSARVLLAMGLIDATMKQIVEPWPTTIEAAA